jgi:uncharacterized protein (TIGR02246 family)
MNDEEQIRSLVENWAQAVHRGDLDVVLVDHSDDIVMFDVPPPFRGVRGIDEYRASWPDFFAWQRSGAQFELTELEVTVGGDAAFAYGLLLCGRPEDLAARPGFQLRLTLGLVRQDDRWQVTHEHHSFPLLNPTGAEQEAGTPGA